MCRTKDYTPEALEKLLKENQAAKYAKEKEKEEREKNKQSETPDVEITRELVNECINDISYFNSLDQNTKYSVRDYIINEGGFMPLHISNI